MIDLGKYISAGDGVWWGQGGAEPEPLVNALLEQADRIGPVRAFCGLTWNERLSGNLPDSLPDSLTVLSYGGLGELRRLSRHGLLDVVPCHYSALPRMFERGQLPSDAGLLQVSPPDAGGLVSLGIGVEYVADALRHTRTLIAEVNHRMPRTRGSAGLPLSAFAAVVETDRPLREAPARAPDAVDRVIADHVASLVEDGDTLQLGVGSLPSAVLESLTGHTDLGFHTGMITDGVTAYTQTCPKTAPGGGPYAASEWSKLHPHTVVFGGPGAQTFTSAGGGSLTNILPSCQTTNATMMKAITAFMNAP